MAIAMSTVENYPIYSFKNTFSLLVLTYFWICIKLMTLIRIFSVGFNGNNTINYFTNKRMIYRFVKISLAHAHVTDFPVVNVHLDELSSARITHTVVYFDWKTGIYIYVCGICCTQYTVIDFSSGPVA
jgi:hypothetical protein